MFKRYPNAGWIAYALACLLFWMWDFMPHAIPQSQFASDLYVIFGGGGFIFFGPFGLTLNERVITDQDQGPIGMALIYGVALIIVFLLQYLYRGIPDTDGAWVRLGFAYLSISPALYFIAQGIGSLLIGQPGELAE